MITPFVEDINSFQWDKSGLLLHQIDLNITSI